MFSVSSEWNESKRLENNWLKRASCHTMGPAAGDELMTAIGFWKHGFVPGINTTEALAEDVYKDNLDFLLENKELDKDSIDSIYLNAKGFGGNNASAGIISPKSNGFS